jgi:AraC-like DNA-binding protein
VPKTAAAALLCRVPVYCVPDSAAVTAERSAFYNDLHRALSARTGYSSREVGWSEDIVVERWSLPAMEWPDHTMSRHRIGVTVTSGPVACSWVEGCGRRRNGVYGPGSINIMPQGLTTRATWTEQTELTTFELSSALVERLLEGYAPAPSEQLIERRCVHDAFAHDIALRVATELAMPTERLYGEMLCLALAAHALGQYGRRKAPARRLKGRLSPASGRRVLEYIRANMDGCLSISALARESGLSDAHFARAFRATFREPPHRLVLRWRLERAARLITKTGLSLAEAAVAAGFCDQAHLTNAMRQHFGRTPRALLNP